NAAACLAIGKRNRDFYSSYGAPLDRIFFAPYSVDTHSFSEAGAVGRAHRAEMLGSLGLEPGIPLVLFVGKLYYKKSPIDIVMAIDRLRRPVNLLVIGDGPLKPAM